MVGRVELYNNILIRVVLWSRYENLDKSFQGFPKDTV